MTHDLFLALLLGIGALACLPLSLRGMPSDESRDGRDNEKGSETH